MCFGTFLNGLQVRIQTDSFPFSISLLGYPVPWSKAPKSDESSPNNLLSCGTKLKKQGIAIAKIFEFMHDVLNSIFYML